MKKLILIAGLFLMPVIAVQSQTLSDLADLKEAFGEAVELTPATDLKTNTTSSSELSDEIKQLEDMMEDVRNDRQESMQAFDNYDQKAQQLYNILSSVLKSIKEMQSAITRNML